MNWTDFCFTHSSEEIPLHGSVSTNCSPRINCVYLRTHCSVPGWPTSLLAGLGWLLGSGGDMPSSRLLLFAAMIQAERYFNRPLSALWGRLWRTPTSLWAPWLSDTECLCSPTPLGNYPHPVQSFSVTPACPFLCLSAWEDERQPKLKSAAAEAQKIWISFGKMGALDFISNWNSRLTYFLRRGLVRKIHEATALTFIHSWNVYYDVFADLWPKGLTCSLYSYNI